jgi:predicted permease
MLSMAMQPAVYAIPDMLRSSRHWGFRVMGRLKTGTSEEPAQAQTEALVRRAILADPPTGEEYDLPRVALNAGGQGLDHLRQAFARPLFVLMVVVAAVLLIACANIAGLLRARAAARQREIGTRLALGAGRGRLTRQLLTESVLLAVIGGSLGIALAYALRNLLPRVLSPGPEALQLALEPDRWMLVFSIGVPVLAGLVCGLLPAFHATRLDLAAMLGRTGSSPTEGPARSWTGEALVTAQVALSLVLLVGAGLFIRTLVNLRSEVLGFRPESLLLFRLDPTLNGYKEARLKDFYEQALNRLASVAGVRSVTLSRWGILGGQRTTDSFRVPGYPDQGQGPVNVHVHYVAPGYFQTMGIPLLKGREITWRDREGAPRVALVNQALASRLFRGAAPIGQRIGPEGGAADEIEIVGLAADAKFASLRESTPPTLYLPYRQHPQHLMTFAVRATSDPTALLGSIRRTLAALDPNVPLFDVRTQVEQIDLAVRQERLFAHLLSGFALLALILACLGTYGTLAYSVARRTPEIGLRLALGAQRSDVVLMVLRKSLVPVAVGVVLGIGGALAAARLVRSMLFGLAGQDMPTLGVAVLVLVASASLAAWLPSLRASRLDPMSALRCD